MIKYELYNLTTNELISNNLTSEEVHELFETYSNFFPDCEIAIFFRDNNMKMVCKMTTDQEEAHKHNFYTDWIGLMDELYSIGNIS